MEDPNDFRALVLAPTRRDAGVTSRLLGEVGISCIPCETEQALLTEIGIGAGLVVLTDDLARRGVPLFRLQLVLEQQPDWSELPLIALARSDPKNLAMLHALPGVVLLERPVHTRTLISAAQAALRARRRQYQMRGQFEQIRRSNRELEQTARAKDEFLATLSHELRNPLNALSSASALLRHESDRPEAAKLAREIVARQTGQMSRLLDDLLDISRITRQRLEIRKARTDVANIVTAAVESVQPLIEAHSHRLRVTLPESQVMLDADPIRISQVIANLLTNASKYMDPGGMITLSATVDVDELVVAVRDEGIGIPPEALCTIFDMFSQLRPALERAEGGLGIGLALAKGIVQLHGGLIMARSDGIGRGSEFVFRLPLGTSAVVPAPAERQPRSRSVARDILVVDDNVDGLEAIAELLRVSGHSVRVARNGQEALALLGAKAPEVMLLDIGMPGMNGYEVAQRVRAQSHSPPIRLIAVTGWGQPGDKRRAEEAGFDHHLTKPIEFQQLQAMLS